MWNSSSGPWEGLYLETVFDHSKFSFTLYKCLSKQVHNYQHDGDEIDIYINITLLTLILYWWSKELLFQEKYSVLNNVDLLWERYKTHYQVLVFLRYSTNEDHYYQSSSRFTNYLDLIRIVSKGKLVSKDVHKILIMYSASLFVLLKNWKIELVLTFQNPAVSVLADPNTFLRDPWETQ